MIEIAFNSFQYYHNRLNKIDGYLRIDFFKLALSTNEFTPHISIREEIFLFIAAINCSLLGVNAIIVIPWNASGLQTNRHFLLLRNNKVPQRKILPRLMSGITFHFILNSS